MRSSPAVVVLSWVPGALVLAAVLSAIAVPGAAATSADGSASIGVSQSSPAAGSAWLPQNVLLQAAGGEETESITLGLQWVLPYRWHPTAQTLIEGRFEIAFGRWRARQADRESAWSWVSQLSLVPVARWRGLADSGPYLEIGIGPSYLTPIYESFEKQFSSQFQFRDHLAAGWTWGEAGRHDLSVRFEHFSNAGIERPNPGINLIGLRYTMRF